MTMCTNCKQDTYSEIYEAKAMADCISCSGTKTTGANNTGNINISACVCKKDIYYQDQNDCFACPRGSICNRPAYNFDQDGVVIQEVYPTAGHWRSKDTDAYFSPCAKSLVGQGNAEDMAKARCCPLNSTTNISICNLGQQDNWKQDHQCLLGYVGPLCMICAEDYIRVGVNCEPCPGGSDITGAVMSLLGCCVLIMIFVFVKVTKTKEPDELKEGKGKERAHFVGEVIILISYMQILSGLGRINLFLDPNTTDIEHVLTFHSRILFIVFFLSFFRNSKNLWRCRRIPRRICSVYQINVFCKF